MGIVECQTASAKTEGRKACRNAARVLLGPEGALIAVVDGSSAASDGIGDCIRVGRALDGIARFQLCSDPEEVLEWTMARISHGFADQGQAQDPEAATLVASVMPTGKTACSWCGDVRACVGTADGSLLPITKPRACLEGPSRFAGNGRARIRTESFTLVSGDTLLVMTNGVWETLGGFGLAACLDGQPKDLALRIVDAASSCGGGDCTVATARFVA